MRTPWVGVTAMAAGMLASAAIAAHAPAGDTMEGRVLYGRYCASCHGVAADGHGPVASVLTRAPSDLRQLQTRFGSPLSVDRVARFVDGREEMTAHGSREMPVWGERFRAPEPEGSERPSAVDRRIVAIVRYLATLQTKAP